MDLQTFRTNLRKELKNKKMSLNTLSFQADLSEDTLRSIIYGKSQDIKLSTMLKIADVLNCTLDDLVGRSVYSKEQRELLNRICHLPKRSIRTMQFILDLEEGTYLSQSKFGTEHIRIIIPTGNMKDGMFYDTSSYEELNISAYPHSIKKIANIGLKITTRHFEPIYYENDILLLSNIRTPDYNDIVLYIDQNGKLYLRKYTHTGLEPVNGFGKRISCEEQRNYKAIGVVLKLVREL